MTPTRRSRAPAATRPASSPEGLERARSAPKRTQAFVGNTWACRTTRVAWAICSRERERLHNSSIRRTVAPPCNATMTAPIAVKGTGVAASAGGFSTHRTSPGSPPAPRAVDGHHRTADPRLRGGGHSCGGRQRRRGARCPGGPVDPSRAKPVLARPGGDRRPANRGAPLSFRPPAGAFRGRPRFAASSAPSNGCKARRKFALPPSLPIRKPS